MNPYEPPRTQECHKFNWKNSLFSLAAHLAGLFIIIQVVFLYLIVLGGIVRWLR